MLAQNKFREDLYYRINVIQLTVPPLHQRKEDIPILCDHILSVLARHNQSLKPILTQEALHGLLCYAFPGNVRELENILERAVALCDGKFITMQDLALVSNDKKQYSNLSSVRSERIEVLGNYINQQEKESILGALTQTHGNKTKAAELLGVSFRTLRYRIKKLGL